MDWKRLENKAFTQAILCLDTVDEAQRFLRDLLTPGEIEEFAKRFHAAEMLSENVPYSRIEKKTGLSSATVARVSKWLNRGEGGYRSVINKLHRHSSPLARED